jgi:hypothetical protein
VNFALGRHTLLLAIGTLVTLASKASWEVYCTQRAFQSLQSDTRFQRILTLARIVNSIRFIETAVAEQTGADTPSSTRQRISSLLYLSAVLHEGLEFADRLGQLFHDHDAFRSGLAKVLSDKDVKALRRESLIRLRNKAVYHHDDAVVSEALPTMVAQEYVFASGSGPQRGATYYELADITLLHYALDLPESPGDFITEVRTLLEQITRTAIQFADASDRLIVAVLKELNWKTRRL